MIRCIALAALLALTGCLSSNQSVQVAASQPVSLRAMAKAVAAEPSFQPYLSQCPGSLLPSKSFAASSKDCSSNPKACFEQCLAGDGPSCFGAAREIEKRGERPYSELTFRLFSAACARGDANACTNAAATVKNGAWNGDKPRTAASASCQFKTYDTSCKAGSKWGCYMRGLEYLNGSSAVSKSPQKARASFRAACKGGKDTSACRAASSFLN